FCSELYSAAGPYACPCRAGDKDLDSMRWPNLLARPQMKRVVGDVTFHIRQKILVGRDAESRGPALPFNFECSSGVDLGKGADSPVISFDVAVAPDAYPSAASGESDTEGQKYKCDLLHVRIRLL